MGRRLPGWTLPAAGIGPAIPRGARGDSRPRAVLRRRRRRILLGYAQVAAADFPGEWATASGRTGARGLVARRSRHGDGGCCGFRPAQRHAGVHLLRGRLVGDRRLRAPRAGPAAQRPSSRCRAVVVGEGLSRRRASATRSWTRAYVPRLSIGRSGVPCGRRAGREALCSTVAKLRNRPRTRRRRTCDRRARRPTAIEFVPTDRTGCGLPAR
jgi:hypothetical protein